MASTNLAARAGRWSANNWKKAFFGWLVLAVVALMLGMAAGHKQIADSEAASGEAAKAQRILEQAARSSDATRLIESVKDVVGKKGSSTSERDQLAACLRAVASLLRDLGLLSVHADSSAIANADLQPQLSMLSKSYDADRATRAYSAVDRALAALERNASPKVVVDWLVLQI